MALYTILLRSRSRAVRGEGLSDVLCMGTGMVVVRKETTGEDVCEGDRWRNCTSPDCVDVDFLQTGSSLS